MGGWKKEVARDIVSLGSIPFYLIAVVRVMVGENLHPYYTITYQLILTFLLILLISLIFKKSNSYVARSFALLVFTSLNYMDFFYTFFASLLWLAMVACFIYLKRDKPRGLVEGFLNGLFSTIVSYYFIGYIISDLNLPV